MKRFLNSPVAQYFLSAFLLYALGLFVYTQLPYYRDFIGHQDFAVQMAPQGLQSLMSFIFLIVGANPLAVLWHMFIGASVLMYVRICLTTAEINLEEHRPYLFWKGLMGLVRRNSGFIRGELKPAAAPYPSQIELTSLRYYLVKFFFLPMMLNFLFGNLSSLLYYRGSFHIASFQSIPDLIACYLAWYYLILMVDTACFTLGYAVEIKSLNRVRSVEPTLLGWVVALACYVPFNEVTAKVLGWGSQDSGSFGTPWLTALMLGISLMLFLIYGAASLALGFKASNLTNRGIVRKGPYAWVRHPAYAAKNLGWIVMGLPLLNLQFRAGEWPTANWAILFSLIAWACVYYVRALTEERHLLADPDYQEYCQKVRYRFIPGVY